MPSEPIPGLQWLVPKLLKDLTESKMWPIKLTGVKHQDTLRDFQALNYKIIKLYINTYVYKSNITIAYIWSHTRLHVPVTIQGDTLVVQSKALEECFYPLKHLLDSYTQDSLAFEETVVLFPLDHLPFNSWGSSVRVWGRGCWYGWVARCHCCCMQRPWSLSWECSPCYQAV